MLSALRDYCDEKALKVYLCGGTLLGAVRHGGFIPWDDDVDVCMPRPDYERLLGLRSDLKMKTGFELVGYFGNGLQESPFLKLLDKRVVVKAAAEIQKTNLWLDIFPIDALPDDAASYGELCRRSAFLRTMMIIANSEKGTGRNALHAMLKNMLRPALRSMRLDLIAARRMTGLAQRIPYGSTAHVGGLTWGRYGEGERMSLRGFEESTEVEFEGEKYQCMSCWDEYLNGIYGDYMQLPPEEKRASHDITAWWADEVDANEYGRKEQ